MAAGQAPATFDPALFTALEWRPLVAGDVTAVNDLVTDQAFPFRVCGTRSDGQAVCAVSRPDPAHAAGWVPVGIRGPVAPDPLDQHLIFGARLLKFDRRTGQAQWVGPPAAVEGPAAESSRLAFAPRDARTLFLADRGLWRTSDAGQRWTAIGPSLSGQEAIVALAPSYVDARTIWAGTNDGRLSVTRDGGAAWTDATPAGAAPATAVRALEASHFDPDTAYVALDTAGAGAGVFRTRDGGRSWVRTVAGMTDAGRVLVIREDAQRRGLLFAGTDRGVFVSFDDGERWQELRVNLPDGPVTDLVLRDSEIVVATESEGVWRLADFSPLRQLTPDVVRASAFVFRSAPAWRARGPAAGAVFFYLLGADAEAPVVIDIVDPVTGAGVWRLPATEVSSRAGLHRVAWDLRHGEGGPLALPGAYQVHLTVAGQSYRQALVVRLDPRVRVSNADLELQFTLSKRVYDLMKRIDAEAAGAGAGERRRALDALRGELAVLFERLQAADARPTAALESAALAAITRAEAAIGGAPRSGVRPAAPRPRRPLPVR